MYNALGGSSDVQTDMCKYFGNDRPGTQKTAASPALHSASRGIRVASRPPHTAALGNPDERTGADDGLGERGAWRALLGTDRSLPGMADNS